jgi:succinate dehydrogenase/fumarate reductase flavoprotein subunit
VENILSYDIIVVGGGGSGLAAAVESARAGARVVVIERNAILRGSTGMSVGSVTSSQTDLQRAHGIIDTPDEHYEDMGVLAEMRGARDNLELRRILVDEVPETVRWLQQLGVVFFGPMPEPPHKKPRMHNVLPNSRAYIHYLSKECRRRGVDFVMNARVKSLVKDADRVAGVVAAIDDKERIFQARRAVILASGDYNAQCVMRSRFANAGSEAEGVNTNEGDGQSLGLKEGSDILNGNIIWGPLLRLMPPKRLHPLTVLPPWRPMTLAMRFSLEKLPAGLLRPFIMSFVTTFIAPERALFRQGAILVNSHGARFTDEMDRPAYDVPLQPGKKVFIVMGTDVIRKFKQWPNFVSTAPGVAYAYLPDYKRTRADIYYAADTLDELARKIGVSPPTLGDTIASYNKVLTEGRLKNRSADIKAIGEPPFCALGPVESRIVITDGGLKVSSHHEVLRSDETVVNGLYAVGSVGQGGLLLEGHGHHLAWAFTSGRRAGRFATAQGRAV